VRRIVSFSLWGANPIHTVGALRNAELAAELLPDWICYYFCYSSVPRETVSALRAKANVVVCDVAGPGDNRAMFDRFFPAAWDGVERMICRDTDSRLSKRELLAVEEWIAQDTDFHIIRDHPSHGVPILGGMWGAKGGQLRGIADAAMGFNPTLAKGQDQKFLKAWVWPKILSKDLTTTVHDPIFARQPFPPGAERGARNNGVWFIGQVFDEHDRGLLGEMEIELLTAFSAACRAPMVGEVVPATASSFSEVLPG
jgi:hypothetical protein